MRGKLGIVLIFSIYLISGCTKVEKDALPLKFEDVSKIIINELQSNSIKEVILERQIDEDTRVFLYRHQEGEHINGGISVNNNYYDFGEVSMDGTPEELLRIEEIQVLGKKAVKIKGILGGNYAQSFYWFFEEELQNSLIQVDGNATEVDLDNDGKSEIIASWGTIPETRIYKLEQEEIVVSDINKSIGAQAVLMIDNKNLFEVYFEPNQPEQYEYYKDSFKKSNH
ncbi:hypothetical protein EDC18_103309 [Natranaerovirga pectinivora]|uniref:Uncharacterized protein n=1 Tax=Natranaerovirga pectinivora TaxID=682400 RepID=A0A4R3MR07_9FIRM|nr:hypothetical protein [Natranaerovirga pectinivora]TCT15601.1 hypothetical protein EDC18_103309 [Natranaerovirga pectinivora]